MDIYKQFAEYEKKNNERKAKQVKLRKKLRASLWFIETYNGKFWATNNSALKLVYGFTSYKTASDFIQKQMNAITH